jgi:hypothetical protein
MAGEHERHIFLSGTNSAVDYTYAGGTPRGGAIPQRDPDTHRNRLVDEWAAIWAKKREEDEDRKAVQKTTKQGVYIQFETLPGFDVPLKSLEDLKLGIKLLNVTEQAVPGPTPSFKTIATVYYPAGKESAFRKKLDDFASKVSESGDAKNQKLIAPIESVRMAYFESFWRDDPSLMPSETTRVWCEVWLWYGEDADGVIGQFQEVATNLDIQVKVGALKFPERVVLLGFANQVQLRELTMSLDYLAEFRRAKESAAFFMGLSNREQTAFAQDLLDRLQTNPAATVAVTVLDTGANNGHMLLARLLADGDCHTVDPDWGTNDHHRFGHGTMMCGLVAFGDLAAALDSTGPLTIPYCLESSKILPVRGSNDPELYGYVTKQGISRAEIQAPGRVHIGCMAVASTDGRDFGRPSSWSAAVDALCSGANEDENPKRLMIVSAGNLEHDQWDQYPQSCVKNYVHDPAQSWNALTVGAITQKVLMDEPGLQDHQPLASVDQLSPFSTTTACEPTDRGAKDKWPCKPDIVMEGGNIARGPDGFVSEHDSLSLLSTGHEPRKSQFGLMHGTSAAAALTARMAAHVMDSYPNAWPETVRGLLVHSARWPDPLIQQCLGRQPSNKGDYQKLLQFCGYGVPSLERAIYSTRSSLTMITQAELQPFEEGSSEPKAKDMHLHTLPWPAEVLQELADQQVTLRLKLSYFVEPSPGERGWRDRYVYPSHQLRFDLNKVNETPEEMAKRISKAARDEGEIVSGGGDGHDWRIGSNGRKRGSIHSDSWTGTAADIATTNLVAVYPATGWWKTRQHLKQFERMVRYTLIVSLETPAAEVDIYTPVAVQVGIKIPT